MKHHFLPVFYLRGFSDSYPKKNGKLFEFDLETASQRGPCYAKTLAFKEDLYKAEVGDGDDPNEIETFWNQEFENKVAPVFWSIYETGKLPSGDARAYLISFIAMMAVRVPVMREAIESLVNRVFRDGLLAHSHDYESFERFISVTPISIPRHQIEAARQHLRWCLQHGGMSNNVFLESSLHSLGDLIGFLERRTLRLRVCEPCSPNLICPDWPVRFIPSFNQIDSPCINVRLESSVLPFRLNKRMVLFVGPPGPEYESPLTRVEALCLNRIAARSAFGARRFIYSADQEFEFMGDAGETSTASTLIRSWTVNST